ncbi:MAG: T9SS type A sorting domain-containing protein, partial [Bacteroidales bacterium]|nr:T9SS type A sorting domain-containing protein [Bacteroidales bacterium]
SSCTAPADIEEQYKVDASVITLRKFYENNLSYKDSIEIPNEHLDTVLNALLAVWNATSLPARDTVVDLLEISTAHDYAVKYFNVRVNQSAIWAQKLYEGYTETGNDTVDNILNTYNLSIYNSFPWGTDFYFQFTSQDNYNMPELSKLFDSISGVKYVLAACGYDNPRMYKNIEAYILPNYVFLKYSYGWGDCTSGCIDWRYWEFKVYYDCSVEYWGSYGSELFPTSILNNFNNAEKVNIYPNPANDKIFIEYNKADFSAKYSIFNHLGTEIFSGQIKNDITEIDISTLPNGIYFLKTENEIMKFVVIK